MDNKMISDHFVSTVNQPAKLEPQKRPKGLMRDHGFFKQQATFRMAKVLKGSLYGCFQK